MLPHTDPDFISDQLHISLTNFTYLSGSNTPNPHRGYQSSSMLKTASSQARAPTPMARNGLVRASCPTTTGRSSCEPEASLLVPRFSFLDPGFALWGGSCPLARPCRQLRCSSPVHPAGRERVGFYHVAVASFAARRSSL